MDIEEFEREGRAGYAALATTIATILAAAIGTEEGYRLQQLGDKFGVRAIETCLDKSVI